MPSPVTTRPADPALTRPIPTPSVAKPAADSRPRAERYGGLWLPLVTPLRPDGALDLPALQALVADALRAGVAGFVPCGSTGEAGLLSADEQTAVLRATLQAADGRPVLAGVQAPRAQAVAELAQALAEAAPGVAGFLLAPPPYLKPSQAGLVDYFHQVAEAAPRPIVAYDIPARTGVKLAPATLRALAEHPRIEALKDCSADRAVAEAVLADGRLALLGGNDDELFDQLARGAVGAITASAHLATAQFVRLQRCLARGDLPAARALWRRLQPLTQALFAEPNPAPLKAVLARQGRLANVLRAPMTATSAACSEAAWQALTAIEREEEALLPA